MDLTTKFYEEVRTRQKVATLVEWILQQPEYTREFLMKYSTPEVDDNKLTLKFTNQLFARVLEGFLCPVEGIEVSIEYPIEA